MYEPLTRTHEDFFGFCRWLVEERDFSASDLLQVIETPWSWEHEFRTYLEGEEEELEQHVEPGDGRDYITGTNEAKR